MNDASGTSNNGHDTARRNSGIWSQSLLLSVLAGASTCLGAAVVLCRKSSAPLRKAHLAAALSLAGSVMITVSMFSLLPEAFEDSKTGELLELTSWAVLERVGSFVAGCVLYAILSKCAFPEPESILGFEENNGKEIDQQEEGLALMERKKDTSKLRIRSQASSASISGGSKDDDVVLIEKPSSKRTPTKIDSFGHDHDSNHSNRSKTSTDAKNIVSPSMTTLSSSSSSKKESNSWWATPFSTGEDLGSTDARRAWRVTLLLFVSLAVHNFPEGLAVAASSLHSPHLGLTTAVAIGLHNIPEGIAIAIPCLAARPDSPYLAFGLASLSGLTEPLGALVALTVLQVDHHMDSMGNWLSFVASIMISVAVWELFPEGWRNAVSDDAKKVFWAGAAVGFFVMVFSDWVLDQSIEEE